MADEKPEEKLLVCNCQRTMDIDGGRLAAALGQAGPLVVHTELCRGQTAVFEAALAGEAPLHVACTQEAPLFREIAAERGHGEREIRFTNIRERAGWSDDRPAALPKMAALLAEARHAALPAGLLTLKSEGVCLVYGAGQAALEAAQELTGRLSVTLLLTDTADVVPPSVAEVPIYKGRVRKAKGHLGAFEIEVDGYAALLPSAKGALDFAMPRNGATSTCDVILDLSGGTPLFAESTRRDGYVRADPASPVAVAKALFKVSDLVGEFEKPRYVGYDAGICAHARSRKVGCTNCLDVCPTGAIAPDGDHVAIDAAVCGGCGSCSAVCPTGAVSYHVPRREDLVARVQVLLRTYRSAGGVRPVLLMHDASHGSQIIAAMARLGRGLPANVLPMLLNSVFQLGHDLLAAMLASGADEIVVLAPPDHPDELPALERQTRLLQTLLQGLGYAGGRVRIVSERDPDLVEQVLHGLATVPVMTPHAFSGVGSKRDIGRVALAKLHEAAPRPADVLALPAGAPYGRIRIRTAGCTLCLACVGACPANALADHPDRPQVSFTEVACVQCGVCVATCPENVIALEPRYDFTSAAMTPVVLHGEEPYSCVSCGKPFGVKATVAKVLERLKGHSMFPDERQLRLIQMCDTCRVMTLAEDGNDPFKSGERPRIRTTEDYVAAAAAKRQDRTPDDFLS